MRGLWVCVATRDGGQLPTFFLQEDVHGIVSEAQAQNLAQVIVGPGATVYVAKHENAV